MDFILNIFSTIKPEDLPKQVISILIAIVTITLTSFFSSKISKHQKNILKLEHLKVLKDLIDKRAYEIKAYQLIVEETVKSYIGYSINFETIKALFKTEQPSYTLGLYKDFRFNLEMDISKPNCIVYKNKQEPWKYGVLQLCFAGISFIAATIFLVTAVAFIAAFSVNHNANQFFVLLIIFIAFLIAGVAFFIATLVLIDRAGNYLLRQSQLQKMLDSLNAISMENK